MKANRAKNLALITPSTLIVGVDGHSKSNTAGFCLASGIEIIRPKKFTNDRKGFLELLDRVNGVMKKHNLDKVIFVLEPNGPYWMLLARFLLERNHMVKVVSALQVKRNRETSDCSPDKNDVRDARSAADLGRQGKFSDTTLPGPIYEDLRSLTKVREGLVEERSMQKHRLRAMLVRTFPELVSCVCDIFGRGIKALLKVTPTAGSVVSLGVDGVAKVLKEGSKGRLGKKKAREIVAAARESVGYALASSAVHIEIDAILCVEGCLTEQIERIEAEMKGLLTKIEEACLLLSIPGIGEISAAAILGETGGLKQYQNPNQIRKLAGLDLAGRQSGERQGKLSISKRGRKILRKVLYQVAVASIRCNEVLSSYYRKLTNESRRNTLKKKEALIAVAGKLVEIMFSLVRSGNVFDAKHEWVPPGQMMKQAEVQAA